MTKREMIHCMQKHVSYEKAETLYILIKNECEEYNYLLKDIVMLNYNYDDKTFDIVVYDEYGDPEILDTIGID